MSKAFDRIGLLQTFVRIAEAGSISAAGRDLGISQPAASRQLAELENRLSTQLFRRSTHSLALTDAGAELLVEARQLIEGWELMAERHRRSDAELRGGLKVVAPVALGQQHLARIAFEFQHAHPGVDITWLLEDEPVRFSEVGCDCWVKVGPVPDERLVVRKLGAVSRLLVASSAFVAEYGQPGSPQKAALLPLVALAPYEGGRIPLARGGTRRDIEPPVRMQTNNIFALKQAVSQGLGMAVLPAWFVAGELADGALVDLLPDWRAPSLDINLAYAAGRYQSQRLRRFVEWLQAEVPSIEGVDA